MQEGERRLAAIMFTDMVGYTALTQSDESRAMKLLEMHNQLLRPIFPKFHGREVKTIGDSFLVEFGSALDAVQCATEAQSFLHNQNASSNEEWKIRLKIGIHLGDVIHQAGDVFGDAVNIASRIVAIAEPEGVCVSGQVFDQVRNKISRPLVRLAQTDLKNIQFPIDVYKIVMPWEQATSGTEPTGATLSPNRIAILPFANYSPDPNDEYFADGITDEIISTVSGISGLSVISRTSVMRYKQSAKGSIEIGRELNAGKLLEGSVRKAGNRIRITVQLIDTKSDSHLWVQSYDRNMEDIFETQSDIARKIADVLKLGPTAPPQQEGQRENLEAYTLCLKARSLWNKRTKEANEQAMLLFQDALRIDPNSARANAGLADCYFIALDWRFMDRKEGQAKAMQFVKRSLELDEELPEAHATLGMLLYYDYRYDDAQTELAKAISINPSYATAHQWRSMVLRDVGKLDEALDEIKKASSLDPLSPVIMWHLAGAYYLAGRSEDSMSALTKVIQTEPGIAYAYLERSLLSARLGKKEDALKDLEIWHRLTRDECDYKINRATMEAIWGNNVEGLKLISEALPRFEEERSLHFQRTSPMYFYGIIGDREQFFKWAELAIEDHALHGSDLRYEPLFQKIREDPRFAELFRKLGLRY